MKGYKRITRKDRYQIQKYLSSGKDVSWIADRLGFHRSTVYREFKRGVITVGTKGCTPKGQYSALKAHRDFLSVQSDSRRGCFYKGFKINGWIEDQIRIKLSQGWSPEQISNRLKMEKEISISPEGIYKFILSCKKRGDHLHEFLRFYRRGRKRFKRRSRYWELQYKRRKSIDNRPHQASQRLEAGHWERDLMLGLRGTGAVLTTVDRKTHFTLLEKLQTTFAKETNLKTEHSLRRSKLDFKSITNDNGHEFGEFWELEKSLKIPIYFTHPLCPWERGTVENTIGLLRQFIPKGSDLTHLSASDLKQLEDVINSRPRKSLGFKTPKEVVSGKRQRLITQKRIEPLPPEYYEQFYLTAEEILKKKKFREKNVALSG